MMLVNFSLWSLIIACAIADSNAKQIGKIEHNIPDSTVESITKYVASYSKNSVDATSAKSCTVNGTNSCPISSMPADQSTLVYPGGNTRCILSTSTPYAFQVIPGASDKLIIYFQGGGKTAKLHISEILYLCYFCLVFYNNNYYYYCYLYWGKKL